MGKGRLEAFSDGVLAILITIMVLELKVPQGGAFRSLQPLLPGFNPELAGAVAWARANAALLLAKWREINDPE